MNDIYGLHESRIRKIKCDEGRPACQRCVSTGRSCDGYGIWDSTADAANFPNPSALSKDSNVILRGLPYVSVLTKSTDETHYFEWFKCRALKKLPGAFILNFWNTLIFQASLDEPAVWHAVLTLSSVHKEEMSEDYGEMESKSGPDQQEQFMLQHYTNAIHHLEPHFLSKDKASVRVALITCLVFIHLEFLRGRFQTAQNHLQNGLKVLRELQVLCNTKDGILISQASQNSSDNWIVEAFSRIYIQVELFKHTYRHRCLVLHAPEHSPAVSVFYCLEEAWKALERLLSRIIHLVERTHQHQDSNDLDTKVSSKYLEEHQLIQAELKRWVAVYQISAKFVQSEDPWGVLSRLLSQYYTMACIMVNSCLWPDDESIFDAYNEQFVLILKHSIYMWKLISASPRERPLAWHRMDMSRSILDIGWIPPLYFVALKCRVHRVRLHSIRLIESAAHREGIWDSRIAARTARTVMEIEESDFYDHINILDNFPLSSYPEQQDFLLPILPRANRMLEVKVTLPDRQTDYFSISYRQEQSGWQDVQVSMEAPDGFGSSEPAV